jgi:hypothetical protein
MPTEKEKKERPETAQRDKPAKPNQLCRSCGKLSTSVMCDECRARRL